MCLHQQAAARHWHLSYLLYRWAADLLFRWRCFKKKTFRLRIGKCLKERCTNQSWGGLFCSQVLSERVVCEVRALVVLPTKELCQQVSLDPVTLYFNRKTRESSADRFPLQVFKVFTTYAEGTVLKVVMVAGQKSFAAEQALLSEIRSVHFVLTGSLVKDMSVVANIKNRLSLSLFCWYYFLPLISCFECCWDTSECHLIIVCIDYYEYYNVSPPEYGAVHNISYPTGYHVVAGNSTVYVVGPKKRLQDDGKVFFTTLSVFGLNSVFYLNVLLSEGVWDAVWLTLSWQRQVVWSTTSTRIQASVSSISGFLWVVSKLLNHK